MSVTDRIIIAIYGITNTEPHRYGRVEGQTQTVPGVESTKCKQTGTAVSKALDFGTF